MATTTSKRPAITAMINVGKADTASAHMRWSVGYALAGLAELGLPNTITTAQHNDLAKITTDETNDSTLKLTELAGFAGINDKAEPGQWMRVAELLADMASALTEPAAAHLFKTNPRSIQRSLRANPDEATIGRLAEALETAAASGQNRIDWSTVHPKPATADNVEPATVSADEPADVEPAETVADDELGIPNWQTAIDVIGQALKSANPDETEDILSELRHLVASTEALAV